MRDNKEIFEKHLIGHVGFNCSFRGKFFNGFAGEYGKRNYQEENKRNIKKQMENLKNVYFSSHDYLDLILPKNSIIYCDPPYENTIKYKNQEFNHKEFWNWCREKIKDGHEVFISEYNAPEDFECIWEKEIKSSLSNIGSQGGFKNSREKLFKMKGV